MKFWPYLAAVGVPLLVWGYMSIKLEFAVWNARKAEKALQIEICDDLRRKDAATHNKHVTRKKKAADSVKVKRLSKEEIDIQCASDPNCRGDGA